jgi:hypothetical protein
LLPPSRLVLIASPAFADIQHIVVIRYKPGVTAEQKAGIATRFLALKDLAKRNGKRYKAKYPWLSANASTAKLTTS